VRRVVRAAPRSTARARAILGAGGALERTGGCLVGVGPGLLGMAISRERCVVALDRGGVDGMAVRERRSCDRFSARSFEIRPPFGFRALWRKRGGLRFRKASTRRCSDAAWADLG
jgi:hypothetical protein